MRSSQASGSISSVFQPRPWLQWLVVLAIPMVYFLIHKLASLSVILDSLATREEDRTSANQAKGVLLGMLEDFIVTVLLVVALVLVELASLGFSRLMLWAGADEHFHTSMILRAVGHFTRFVAVFTLVAITLAPFSLDMALLRAQKARLSTDQPSARDQLHARSTAQGDSDFDAMVGVILVALAFTVIFVWLVDLVHWWPTHEAPTLQVEPISRRLSFSTPTYMDIRFEPYRVLQMDLETGKPKSDSCDEGTYTSSRHTTIVSAPDELYGDDEPAQSSHTRGATASWRDQLLVPWLRIVLVMCAALGVFMLLADVTRATSQLASPVVAGIALNASLNELVHGLFQVQFLPGTV